MQEAGTRHVLEAQEAGTHYVVLLVVENPPTVIMQKRLEDIGFAREAVILFI